MKVVHIIDVYYTMCGKHWDEIPMCKRTRDRNKVTCKRCLAAMAKEAASQKEPRK